LANRRSWGMRRRKGVWCGWWRANRGTRDPSPKWSTSCLLNGRQLGRCLERAFSLSVLGSEGLRKGGKAMGAA